MRLHHFPRRIILFLRHFDADRVLDRAENVAAIGVVIDDSYVDVLVAEQRDGQVGTFEFGETAEDLLGGSEWSSLACGQAFGQEETTPSAISRVASCGSVAGNCVTVRRSGS